MPVRKAGLYCINKGFKNSVFNSNREIYPDFFIKNPLLPDDGNGSFDIAHFAGA
jgi:hypothetical protein